MGKGFAITSDLNLGKMLLAGYARHIVSPSSNSENGHSAENPSSKKRRLSRLPRIRIAAITNDTVATFASLAYAVKAAPNSRVAMGLIVGTGTNATVPMPLTALHSSKREALANPDSVSTVVINTEWTIRGTDKPLDALSLKTKWDTELDRNSEAPGFQPFEYMTAGRYLGEIVRLIFVDLVTTGAGSCAESMPQSLKSKNALPTRFLSEVVARTPDIESLRQQLAERYPAPSGNSTFWTSERANLIKDIAYAVQQRSSALIAAACIGLLACVGDISLDNNPSPASTLTSPTKTANGNITNATGAGAQQTLSEAPQEDLVIAYTGGTISQYPGWLQTCQHWIDRLVEKGSGSNRGKRVVLKEALDGGIVGAGVLAGMSGGIV
jgi:hexokinase